MASAKFNDLEEDVTYTVQRKDGGKQLTSLRNTTEKREQQATVLRNCGTELPISEVYNFKLDWSVCICLLVAYRTTTCFGTLHWPSSG